jgi:hypothetical protein
MSTLHHAIPVLRLFDEAMTRSFYVDFLEFEIVFEARFHESAPLFMGVRKDGCQLRLSGHFGDATPGSAVLIEVTGLDDYLQRLREKNYKHARPGQPVTQSWGSREIGITDPSGNRLIFYERV